MSESQKPTFPLTVQWPEGPEIYENETDLCQNLEFFENTPADYVPVVDAEGRKVDLVVWALEVVRLRLLDLDVSSDAQS